MRYLIIVAVRLYWILIPATKRRTCIFRLSCSNFVFLAAKEHGFKAAISALRTRLRQCRPGYKKYKAPDGAEYCILPDNSIVPIYTLRDDIFLPDE